MFKRFALIKNLMDRTIPHILYFKKMNGDCALYQAVCITSRGFSNDFSPTECRSAEELGKALRGYRQKDVEKLVNSPPADWKEQEERLRDIFLNHDVISKILMQDLRRRFSDDGELAREVERIKAINYELKPLDEDEERDFRSGLLTA